MAAAVDRDEGMTHPLFRPKLEAMGFGLFIPVFFVASGVAIDVTGGLPAVLVLPAIALAMLGGGVAGPTHQVGHAGDPMLAEAM